MLKAASRDRCLLQYCTDWYSIERNVVTVKFVWEGLPNLIEPVLWKEP